MSAGTLRWYSRVSYAVICSYILTGMFKQNSYPSKTFCMIDTCMRVGKHKTWNTTFGDVGCHHFYCLQEELQVSSGYCAVRYACTHGNCLPINGRLNCFCLWLMTVLITQHLEPVLGYFKNLLWLCPDCMPWSLLDISVRGNTGNQKLRFVCK